MTKEKYSQQMNEVPTLPRKKSIADRIALISLKILGPDIDALNARINQLEEIISGLHSEIADIQQNASAPV